MHLYIMHLYIMLDEVTISGGIEEGQCGAGRQDGGWGNLHPGGEATGDLLSTGNLDGAGQVRDAEGRVIHMPPMGGQRGGGVRCSPNQGRHLVFVDGEASDVGASGTDHTPAPHAH